jgi:ribosomal protein S6--L-glutamate ligase
MNIYFMLAYTRSMLKPNPVLVELFERLRTRGAEVELGVADELVLNPGDMNTRYNLYILKSHTELWLSLAEILHSQGVRMLNPYLACQTAHNKIVAQRLLEASGIPTPKSWVTGNLELLRPMLDECPLILKPYHGGRGVGVTVVRTHDELSQMPAQTQPMLVQRYVPGEELKVSVIEDQVFGIKKYMSPGESVRLSWTVSEEVERIAIHCGEIFGLALYGLDVIEGPDGPLVIDVNYFPSFKGIPHAASLLADYIWDFAQEHRGDVHDELEGSVVKSLSQLAVEARQGR